MRTTRLAKQLSTAAIGVAATLLVGCAATDPSPNMVALGRSDAELAKTYTIATDTNIRQIINDLERTFYTDRPSRLTPISIPH